MHFFETRNLSSGERFFIEYQREEEVQGQYEALKENARFQVKEWNWLDADYSSYCININGIDLIVAAALDGVKEDFLTGLRNIIDAEQIQFKNHSILFLLHKPLDSLISGSDNLCKGGMPLHLTQISESIRGDINKNDSLDDHQKNILDYSLRNKTNSFFIKRRSLFDLAVFLEILGLGRIDDIHYNKLGLFKDCTLTGVPIGETKNIENRLDKNSKWHEQILNAHEYGHAEDYLEKVFSDEGVKFLENSEKWMLADYLDLVRWADEKQNQKGVEYVNNNVINSTPEGLIYWDKSDGESSAKLRRRNICIFNPEKLEEVTLDFEFTGTIYSRGRNVTTSFHIDQLSTSGKTLTAKIKVDDSNELKLHKFGYNDPNSSNKFVFKVLILPFDESLFSGIKTYYAIDNNKAIIEVNPDRNIVFNNCDRDIRIIKLENNKDYELSSDFQLELNTDELDLPEGKTDVDFTVLCSGSNVSLRYVIETQKPDFISGLQVWLDKRENKSSFKPLIYSDNKNREIICLEHGTKRYYVQGEYRDNIKREKEIITQGGLCWRESVKAHIEKINLKVPEDIKQAYEAILNYYKDNKQLPSCSYQNKDITHLYNNFIDILVRYLNIDSRESLSPEIKALSQLGTLSLSHGEGLILFTPLHPINIAYQLMAMQTLSDEKITQQIAERLGATNILPYLKKNKEELYAPIGQSHSPEWIYYSNTGLGSQTIAKNFVPLLIKQKIKEFKNHFYQLFVDPRRPIRINLINMGNCSEALTGIFEYYQDYFNSKKNITEEDVSPMIVHIYAHKKQVTKFEELSQYTDIEKIENEFKLNLHKYNDYDPQVWLDIFHSKVHFYSSGIQNNNYEYAHISFFQFDSTKARVSNYDIEKVPSGLSLGGLISDLSSVNENNNYRSCFGFEDEDPDQNKLTKLARLYNPLIHVAGTDDIYDDKQTTATVINSGVRGELEGIYQASQWITFIDPKVDLSFFKESEDVVIIHYSDQYNNASGYDAITVTKKCSQYQEALKQIMEQDSIPLGTDDVNRIIDIFNAINGDWLLRLNSPKNRAGFKEEKISILAAVKAGLALLDTPDITWIPISLEEILRVSGGVGLSQKDGLFSSKNLGEAGKTSDDVLFIGLQRDQDNVKMHLFPVEVKAGNINAGTVKKAKEQALRTRELLEKHLSQDNISGKIYRNFFAKMALAGASKLSLYNVWPEYNKRWENVRSFRHQLLNDQFSLSWKLDDILGNAGFILFNTAPRYGIRSDKKKRDSLYQIELLQSDLDNFLIFNIENIKQILSTEISVIPPSNNSSTNAILPKNGNNENPISSTVNSPVSMNNGNIQSENTMPANESEIPQLQQKLSDEALRHKQLIILDTFDEFNVNISLPQEENRHYTEGPSSIIYRVRPGTGVKPNKIYDLTETLKLNLSLAGEHQLDFRNADGFINIIVPKNEDERYYVDSSTMWDHWQGRSSDNLIVPIGEDQTGNIIDLNFSSANSPHLLIGGTTGSGKSEALLTILKGMENFYSPEQLRFLLVDPKGTELVSFENSLYLEGQIGWDADDAISILSKAIDEMEKRYQKFKSVHKRDLPSYNNAVDLTERFPWLVIVLDEYADLTANDSEKKDIEQLLKRIAQKARAAGIHVIIATQKPSGDVISTTLRSNLPAQLGLRVRSGQESRVILGEPGAETLIGKGDAYLKAAGKLTRIQCARVSS